MSLVESWGVLLNNAFDFDGMSGLQVELIGQATNGHVEISSYGSFVYTPNLNYWGPDSFTYRVFDGYEYSNLATASLTIWSVNDPPVASNDTFALPEDEQCFTADVLANDLDIDGDALNVVLMSSGVPGQLWMLSGGYFQYIPPPNFVGQIQFFYQVTDFLGGMSSATVTLNISEVNDAPTANNDAYSIDEDNVLQVPGYLSVLANDEDIDFGGNPTSAQLVQSPTNGTLNFGADGAITYTPNANFNGTDQFTYQAVDTNGATSNIATVSITVYPVNDFPSVTDETYMLLEDEPQSGNVLANDTDLESNPLSATALDPPAHGSLTLDYSGNFTYTPDANYHGPDSFTYLVSDGWSQVMGTVTLTVTPVNDAPEAVNHSYTTDEDTPLMVNEGEGLKVGAIDADNDMLTIAIVDQPQNGTLSIDSGTGAFSYTPNLNFYGTDGFTYTVSDGQAVDLASVTLTVAPVNDAPVAISASYAVDENDEVAITIFATDVENDALTYEIISPPQFGELTGTAPDLTYTPYPDFSGPDSFEFLAFDGLSYSNVGHIAIDVEPVFEESPAGSILAEIVSGDVLEGQALTLVGLVTVTNGDLPSAINIINAADGITIGTASVDEDRHFTFVYTFADDDPTATPVDEVVWELTPADGPLNISGAVTFEVGNVAPDVTISLLNPSDVNEEIKFIGNGGSVLLVIQLTDPGLPDTHTVEIDWGDETSLDIRSIQTNAFGYGMLEVEHTYPTFSTTLEEPDRTFEISAKVADDDGGTMRFTAPIVMQFVALPSSGEVTIVADDNTADELDDMAKFTVTRDGDESRPLTITIAPTSPGWEQYRLLKSPIENIREPEVIVRRQDGSFDVTIPSDEDSVAFVLDGILDDVKDGDLDVTLRIQESLSGRYTVPPLGRQADAVIKDSYGAVTIYTLRNEVEEDANIINGADTGFLNHSLVFTITVYGRLESFNLPVKAFGDAEWDKDYTVVAIGPADSLIANPGIGGVANIPISNAFAANHRTVTRVRVRPIGDPKREGQEAVKLEVQPGIDIQPLVPDATGMILDDDNTQLSVTPIKSSVAEGSPNFITYKIERVFGSQKFPLAVSFETAGTATYNLDYNATVAGYIPFDSHVHNDFPDPNQMPLPSLGNPTYYLDFPAPEDGSPGPISWLPVPTNGLGTSWFGPGQSSFYVSIKSIEDAVVESVAETIVLSVYPIFYDEAIGSEAANTAPTQIHDNDAVGVGWVLEGQPEDEVDTYLQLTNDQGQTTEWIRDASGLNWVRYKTTETWERLTFQTPVDSPIGWASSETYNVTIGVGVSVQLQISGGLGIGGSGTNDAWTWEPAAAVALQLAAEGSLTAGQTPRYDPFNSGDDDGKTLSQKIEEENEEKVWKSIPIVKRTRVIEQRIFDPNLSNLTPLGRPLAEVLDALGEPLVTSERVASARKEGESINIVAEWYGLSGSVSAQIWSKVVPQSP